jgi:lysophospholipase L1-like esterase
VRDGDESSGVVFKAPSYHHQGLPQNCQLEFEWCPFRDYDPQEIQVASNEQGYDPWHPNIKGHTIIAEYLYEKLAPGLLLQETPKQPM